jgi:hypothetical protein
MDLFELAAKIKLDSSDYDRGMEKAEKRGKGLANALSGSFEKITKGVKTASKALTVGFGAAVAATVPVIKKAVSAYAKYEQLVGGVETLFKEASVFVLQDAKKAYKEAGISANQYMEIATSFAASLMQGLGGDSVKAAEAANKAIIDMSDNANKMGTDIESIQNAYRGFSKQNFMMLDNLKLGYNGTKTEMERLLKDAEKLTGRKYDISNFADIIDAIHEIQVNMGVAGTTAKEAATTITGSWGSVKASWEDLLVAMADPKGDVKTATQNFIDSGKTMLKNVLPTIRQAISGLGDFIAEVAPMIGEELPKLIVEFLPKFLKAGKNLAQGLWKGIKAAWGKIDWNGLASTVWKGIQDGISELGGLIFGRNKDGSVNWPTWNSVKSFAIEKWEEIKAGAADLAGLIFGKNDKGEVNWPTWESVKDFAKEKWEEIKAGALAIADWLGGLTFGRTEDGSVNWPTWESVKDFAKEKWEEIKAGALAIADWLGGLAFGRTEDGSVNWPTWESVKDFAKEKWEEIKTGALAIAEWLGGVAFGKSEDGSVNWPDWESVKDFAKEKWEAIKAKALAIAEWLGGVAFGKKEDGSVNWPDWETVKDFAKEKWEDIKKGALEIADWLGGVAFGRKEDGSVNWPEWSNVKDKAEEAWNAIKAKAAEMVGLDADATWDQILGAGKTAIINWFKDNEVINAVTDFFTMVFNGALAAIAGLNKELAESGTTVKLGEMIGQGILDALSYVGEAIMNPIIGLFGGSTGGNGDALEAILSNAFTSTLYSIFSVAATALYTAIGKPIETIFTEIKQAYVDLWNLISNFFSTLWTDFTSNVVQPIADFFTTNIIDPIKTFFEPVINTIRNIYNAIVRFFGGNPDYFNKVKQSREVTKVVDQLVREGGVEQLLGLDNRSQVAKVKGYFKSVMPGATPEAIEEAAQEYVRVLNEYAKEVLSGRNLTEVLEGKEQGGFSLEWWDKKFFSLFDGLSYEEFASAMDNAQASTQELSSGASHAASVLSRIQVPSWVVANGSSRNTIDAQSSQGANVNGSASFNQNSTYNAKGAWDIPYDTEARVHANEMILNATQARQYREGNAFGGVSEIVAALHSLRQDMQNIQLVVGEKALGRATVQYGGSRMNGYIGRSERRVAAGYGWG